MPPKTTTTTSVPDTGFPQHLKNTARGLANQAATAAGNAANYVADVAKTTKNVMIDTPIAVRQKLLDTLGGGK
jgi:hypothetical protein